MIDIITKGYNNIHKKVMLITDKENRCGIDITKAVYISDKIYIDENEIPQKTSACMGRQVCRFAELCFAEEEEKKPKLITKLVKKKMDKAA